MPALDFLHLAIGKIGINILKVFWRCILTRRFFTGTMETPGSQFQVYYIQNGVYRKDGCFRERPSQEVGENGWPCYSGGSIAYSSTMAGAPQLQCVVFYFPQGEMKAPNYPRDPFQGYTFSKLKFNEAKKFCTDIFIRRGVRTDMTALAKCLHERYPYIHMNSHGKVPKFLGVAVFPGSAAKHENDPGGFALCAPEGLTVEETLSLSPEDPALPPEPVPDLNIKPPHLYVIAGVGQ